MSDPARTIQGLYDAFAQGDIPAVLGALTAETTWTEAEGFPYAGTYVGPDAILEGVWKLEGEKVASFRQVTDTVLVQRALG